jgi:iron complex transport system substrate-binding protein
MHAALLPILVAAVLVSGCARQAQGGRGGIVSLNPCSDQLLLALVPPGRIAAISHYSQQPGASSIPLDVARRFRTTAGTAEEVIALAPDLVIATSFTSPATRAAFGRAGLHVLYLGSPTTVAESEAQVMQVAEAVGAQARGRALVRRIEGSSTPLPRPPVPALLFISGDLANGAGTLLDDEMRRAGLRNAAADYGLTGTGRLPVETIIAHPPRVILTSGGGGRTAALRRRVLSATGAPTREIAFPSALVNCGGPTIPAAVARMAVARMAVARMAAAPQAVAG